MKTNNKLFFLFLALITAIIIFYNSSKTNPFNPVSEFSFTPYIYHFSIFFLLSFFLIMAERKSRKYLFVAVLISVIYAILDELHQLFVPGRNSSLNDFMTDSIGIFLSAIIVRINNSNLSIAYKKAM
jgi:VanZ family protein